MGNWLRERLFKQLIIFRVAADPNPHEIAVLFKRKCAMADSHPCRPKVIADFLEIQRRVVTMLFQQ